MKRRLVWMALSAAVALFLVFAPRLAKPNRNKANKPLPTDIVLNSEDLENPEVAGVAISDSLVTDDPGQRKMIAKIQADISTNSEDEWMRSYKLTERSGDTISSQELAGQPYIASFFFSRCPGSCKQQNDQMRLLQEKYRDTPIRLVSISVDPEADTPEVLAKYANSYGADKNKWLFFTGDIKYISKIAGEVFLLGQVSERGHPDRFCLVNEDGKLVGKYNWHSKEELQLLDEHVQELLISKSTSDVK